MTIQKLLICIQSILGSPTVDGLRPPLPYLMKEYSLDWNPEVSQEWLSDEARAVSTGKFLIYPYSQLNFSTGVDSSLCNDSGELKRRRYGISPKSLISMLIDNRFDF